MSATSYVDDKHNQWSIFDKFSSEVIHNVAIDIVRRLKAKKRDAELVEYDIDLMGKNEIYPSENIIYDSLGHSCVIETEWLYEAFLHIDDKLKQVLILKYWYKLSRSEIADIINVSEKTVTNRKNKAFKFIRNYRERMLDREIRGP